MKHATQAALDKLEPLLNKLRQFQPLTEKSRGIFYCKSKAFLHFHEDPAGLFADLRIDSDWRRYPVNAKVDQGALLKDIERLLKL